MRPRCFIPQPPLNVVVWTGATSIAALLPSTMTLGQKIKVQWAGRWPWAHLAADCCGPGTRAAGLPAGKLATPGTGPLPNLLTCDYPTPLPALPSPFQDVAHKLTPGHHEREPAAGTAAVRAAERGARQRCCRLGTRRPCGRAAPQLLPSPAQLPAPAG